MVAQPRHARRTGTRAPARGWSTQRRKLSRSASSSWRPPVQVGRHEQQPRRRDVGAEQRQLVLAEHPLGHVAGDQAHLGRQRHARRRRAARPRTGPAASKRRLQALGHRVEQRRPATARLASAHAARPTHLGRRAAAPSARAPRARPRRARARAPSRPCPRPGRARRPSAPRSARSAGRCPSRPSQRNLEVGQLLLGARAPAANRSPDSSSRSSTAGASNDQRRRTAAAPRPRPRRSGRGHRRALARAQGVGAHRGLVAVVLAPVDEHLALAQLPSSSPRRSSFVALLSSSLATAVRERLGVVVADVGVQRHVHLHALRARRLGVAVEAELAPAVSRRSTRHLAALGQRRGRARDRGRRPAPWGGRGPRPAPATGAAPGRPGWPARPASAGRRRARSRSSGRPPGSAPSAPTRARARASASRRSGRRRPRWGSA